MSFNFDVVQVVELEIAIKDEMKYWKETLEKYPDMPTLCSMAQGRIDDYTNILKVLAER